MPRTSLARELRTVRAAFESLARSFARVGPLLTDAAAATATASSEDGADGRRRPRLSAKQRATLKLQGKYMGTMRGLKPRQRAQVKRIRAEKGIRAAIAAAERMAG